MEEGEEGDEVSLSCSLPADAHPALGAYEVTSGVTVIPEYPGSVLC